MSVKLTIGYFYPNLLNLYGDRGNVEILVSRAKLRGFDVSVIDVGHTTQVAAALLKELNIVFMGGGPDSGQKLVYADLVKNKAAFLKDFIEMGKAGLFICGAYQLLGQYYKAADGSVLEGLGILDLYTKHPGHTKKRCVGNVVCELNQRLLRDVVFTNLNVVGNTLVGFENHGGRTFLGEGLSPLCTVVRGFGNNGVDKTEGVFYKNCMGTYLHGPFLARNPHIADFLIAKGLGLTSLCRLDDTLVIAAHTASKNLRQ